MKKFGAYLFVAFLCLCFVLLALSSKYTTQNQSTTLSNDIYNLSQNMDNISIISRELSDDEAIAAVEKDNLWGYIDSKGNWIINPQYEEAGPFSEGYASVCMNGKYGYIDKSGVMVIQPNFSQADDFSNGYACVVENNTLKYIGKSGSTMCEVGSYSNANNVAGWSSGGAMTNRGYAICCYYEPVLNSKGGVETANYYSELIKKDGSIIINMVKNVDMSFCTEELVSVADLNYTNQFFYDLNGNQVTPGFLNKLLNNSNYQFTGIVMGFYDGIGAVQTIDGAYGCIDENGNIIIKPSYQAIYLPTLLSEELMCFCNESSSECGFVDKSGNIVIKALYELAYCHPFSESLACVSIWKDLGERSYQFYINKSGDTVININQNATSNLYYECNSFKNGLAKVVKYDRTGKAVGQSGTSKYGYINKTGQFIIDCQFDDAKDFTFVNNASD